jgi:copper chaperone
MTTKTYIVNGMTCGHCESSVRAELRLVPGVDGVDVDRDSGRVVVSGGGQIDDEAVRAAVEAAGYEVAP